MRKEEIESRKHEVDVLKGTVSRVIGLKFEGSLLLPLLWKRIVQACFHSFGILPDLQTLHKIHERIPGLSKDTKRNIDKLKI